MSRKGEAPSKKGPKLPVGESDEEEHGNSEPEVVPAKKAAPRNAFDLLNEGADDDEESQEEEQETQAVVLNASKAKKAAAKKAKKAKGKKSAFDDESDDEVKAPVVPEEGSEESDSGFGGAAKSKAAQKKAKKKAAPAKKPAGFSAFAGLEEDNEEDETEETEKKEEEGSGEESDTGATPAQKSKNAAKKAKKKAAKKEAPAPVAKSAETTEPADEESGEESDTGATPAQKSKNAAKKAKKKAAAKKGPATATTLEVPSPSTATQQVTPTDPLQSAAPTPVEPTPAPKEGDDEESGDDDDTAGGDKKSKAAAKKAKKKAKEAEKKAEAEKKKETTKKPPSAMVAAIRAQQEAIKKEEERRAAEEVERQRLIKEHEEKLKAEEEARLARIQREKEKKEALKAAGKAVTAADRKKEEARRQMLLKLKSEGRLPPGVEIDEDGNTIESGPPKKVNYGDKRKQQKKPQSDGSQQSGSTTSSTVATPVTPVEGVTNPEEGHDDWEAAAEEILGTDGKALPKQKTPTLAPTRPPVKAPSPALTPQTPPTPVEVVPEGPKLRSPICCVLGHVDTGKTKLLDRIRRTNVQGGEAGGITQQIGATYFPLQAIREQTQKMAAADRIVYNVPGLLIMDTPGHESFHNLRSRGASLCDIAILVVDLMHGLEPQTIESIQLLMKFNTPFVVALNKVDRLYDWKSSPNRPIETALKAQVPSVITEFETRLDEVENQFKEQGLNACLYWKNKDFRKTIALVPTSAMTGEGIPDILMVLVQLTQRMFAERLLLSEKLACTVLEVKTVEGLGTTIDVILVNGTLYEGDKIILCGLEGPIVTEIRALLTPQPMKELRVKSPYMHHKMIQAAQGIKITASNLEKAVAGTPLFRVGPDDDIEAIKANVMDDLKKVEERLDTQKRGVFVQSSTLGSLEALLDFLRSQKIPVCGYNIGPIHKRDVIQASAMLEHKKEYAVILGFDVKPNSEAARIADKMGVKIFTADIIYHLQDMFLKYLEEIKEAEKEKARAIAVFPVTMKILPECIFNAKDPIVVGVEITEGTLKKGTPLCIPSREGLLIGTVFSIENNHREQDIAKTGATVAIKILPPASNPNIMGGRHFFEHDELISNVSRESIDALKQHFRTEVSKDDWKLIIRLKELLKIR